ncbi:MAG TPA: hypothetical protein VHY21_02600 [Pseudonocardiaceae bacterium]|nr:hypothetical protein [Pseudonocardiaceae bacterium]
MPKGGARVVSGLPPDLNALARDRPGDQASWTTLPGEGRAGEPPVWPLIEATDREAALWADLWTRPQAVMWERLDQRYEVAMFVRQLGRAEQPMASVELQKVVRQYLDSLGLSVQGMLRNRWRIVAAVQQAEGQPAAPARARRASSRSRLKVVAPERDA